MANPLPANAFQRVRGPAPGQSQDAQDILKQFSPGQLPHITEIWNDRVPANRNKPSQVFVWPAPTIVTLFCENTQDQDVNVEIHGTPSITSVRELTLPLCTQQIGKGERRMMGCNVYRGDDWAPFLFVMPYTISGNPPTRGTLRVIACVSSPGGGQA